MRCVAKILHAERSLVAQQRQDLVDPALDIRLAHRQPDLLVEHRQQRQPWLG
jgi:hypothetical protein